LRRHRVAAGDETACQENSPSNTHNTETLRLEDYAFEPVAGTTGRGEADYTLDE
jgi:hypothetical protein